MPTESELLRLYLLLLCLTLPGTHTQTYARSFLVKDGRAFHARTSLCRSRLALKQDVVVAAAAKAGSAAATAARSHHM